MAKRPSGCKLLPNAEKGIFVGYTKTDHQYRIFVPARKQIVILADVKFIPYEGDQPVADLTSTLSPHKIHQQTPITSTILLNNWKNSSNVGEGQNIQDLSHNQDPSYLSQSEPSQESSVPTYIQLEPQPSASTSASTSSQNLFNQDHNNNVNSRPKRTKRPRTYEDTITGEWWKTSRDLHQPALQSSNGNNSGDEGQELALLNVIDVSEPKTYNGAKASANWEDWKIAFEEEMSSLKENDV